MNKTCTKCNITYPISNFYKHKKNKDGYRYHCKNCRKKDAAEYYKKQYIDIKGKYQKNKNRFIGNAQKYYKTNKQKVISYTRKWQKENPEKMKYKNYKYSINNPDEIKAHGKVNYAIKKGEIKRKPCIVCGVKNTVAHHENYFKIFDITWLCHKHHMECHVKKRNKTGGKIIDAIH